MEINKQLIRKEKLSIRKSISIDELSNTSLTISKKLFETDEYQEAKNILLYSSYNHEIETKYIFEKAIIDNKKVFMPKVNGNNMDFYLVSDLKDLIPGCKGILEPDANTDIYKYDNNSIMILPLSAFDKFGNRIGYGGGYYDRYLENNIGITKVGIAFSFQETDIIPADEYDIKLDIIITEKEMKRRIDD